MKYWRGYENEEDMPSPYPPEPYIDYLALIERSCGIPPRMPRYPSHSLLITYQQPNELFDPGYFYAPYIPVVRLGVYCDNMKVRIRRL